MKETGSIAYDRNVDIRYQISRFDNNHPNSVQVKLTGMDVEKLEILAASLGGGSFEIQKVDGFKVQIKGDFHEILVWASANIKDQLQDILPPAVILLELENMGTYLYDLKSSKAFNPELSKYISGIPNVSKVANALPIMPIISGQEIDLPFTDIASLIKFSTLENKTLGELGLLYEKHRSGLSESELRDKMEHLIQTIEKSIDIGLSGTVYENRILPQQSHLIKKAEKSKKILQGSIINKIVENVSAIMEAKSALEVIVANPTAGSCGTVGAALKAVADNVHATMGDKIMAYFAAGLVGAYFADGPGFSAEEHGCQVECGASAGMAAAGIVEFFGGTAEQALGAASMAIQNMIGLVCDPIADRVEAPCLGKNTSAAVNALSSATMAVAGFAHLIPLDQVLETVERVSADMPTCVKCTGLGGLAITPAAFQLKEKLDQFDAG
jgi:L-serine dehydratase